MTLERPQGQDFIIVGATGDLSRRKLLPALYNLHLASWLPEEFSIIGLARTQLDDSGFNDLARRSVEEFSRTGLDPAAYEAEIESVFAGRVIRFDLAILTLGEDGIRRCF